MFSEVSLTEVRGIYSKINVYRIKAVVLKPPYLGVNYNYINETYFWVDTYKIGPIMDIWLW